MPTMEAAQPRVTSIFRCPVKGLSAEKLPGTVLAAGQTVPADRLYAIENGPSGFDRAPPAHIPKNRFLKRKRHERPPRLDTHFDEQSHMLTVREGGREAARGDLRTPAVPQEIEAFFAGFYDD